MRIVDTGLTETQRRHLSETKIAYVPTNFTTCPVLKKLSLQALFQLLRNDGAVLLGRLFVRLPIDFPIAHTFVLFYHNLVASFM